MKPREKFDAVLSFGCSSQLRHNIELVGALEGGLSLSDVIRRAVAADTNARLRAKESASDAATA